MTARTRFGLAAGLAGVYAVCYPLIKLGLAYAAPLDLAALRAVLAGAVVPEGRRECGAHQGKEPEDTASP